MGIFAEKNDFEKECDMLIKNLKSLKGSNLGDRDYFIDYVREVKKGIRNNEFYELDFLASVIIKCLDEYPDKARVEFDKLRELSNFLLPFGIDSENYNDIKNMIINIRGKFNYSLYSLFDNMIDYVQIHNIMVNNEVIYKYYDLIVEYAINVSPYCSNQKVLKNEIISFINGLSNICGNVSDYSKDRIKEAKKRKGIYPIDERTLAKISSQVDKAQELVRILEALEMKANGYSDTIKGLTKDGKKEIEDEVSESVLKLKKMKDSALEEIRKDIEEVKKEIIGKLNEYLLELERNLKINSDKVFNELLRDCQSQVNNIRLLASRLSGDTTDELLRIQKASEESIAKLKNYVEGEPILQETLKKAQDSEAVKEAILAMNGKKNDYVVGTSNGIFIPGNDRIVVPSGPNVILPNSDYDYNSVIIPAFDERIPFLERYKKIMDEKYRREAEGEIFHSMVDEVVNCVMEGDWVYLWGPSGCGKSHIIKQVASLVGLEIAENGKITDKYSIMAYNDPHGRFRATQAFVALVYGKMLSLDEFDNGNSDTQVVLNELYSGLLDTLEKPNIKRYVTFAEDMTVPVNPNFRMISAGNTSGEGENEVFSSRGKIDESVQERMTPKRFDYDNRVEERIFGEYKDWYNLFVNFRTACDKYAVRQGLSSAPGMITTRDASSIVKYVNHNSKSVDQIFREKFIQIKDADYLRSIADTLKGIYNIVSCDEPMIYDEDELGKIEESRLVKKLIYDCETTSKKLQER